MPSVEGVIILLKLSQKSSAEEGEFEKQMSSAHCLGWAM